MVGASLPVAADGACGELRPRRVPAADRNRGAAATAALAGVHARVRSCETCRPSGRMAPSIVRGLWELRLKGTQTGLSGDVAGVSRCVPRPVRDLTVGSAADRMGDVTGETLGRRCVAHQQAGSDQRHRHQGDVLDRCLRTLHATTLRRPRVSRPSRPVSKWQLSRAHPLPGMRACGYPMAPVTWKVELTKTWCGQLILIMWTA
jgi:hypothetical protein